MKTTRVLTAIAAGSLLVASCGGSSDDSAATSLPETTPATGAPDAGAETPAAAAVPAALQFTAPLVGGGELDAATLADKPTVFWFWAPT